MVFRSYSSKHTSTLNDTQFPYIMQIPSYSKNQHFLSSHPRQKTKQTVRFCRDHPAMGNQAKALQAGQHLLGLAVGNTAQVRLASGSSRGAFLFLREWLLWACPLFSLPPIRPVSYLGSVQTGSVCMLSLPSTSIAINPWCLVHSCLCTDVVFVHCKMRAYPNRRCFHIKKWF